MTRRELAKEYAAARPDLKRGAIIAGASQVWRFANEVQVGDHVITYNPSTRKYLVGQITGEFSSKPNPDDPGLTMTRKTKWLGEIDRDDLTDKAKNSLGSTCVTAEF